MSEQEHVNRNDINWIKESLIRIEKQTTETNGRVSSLETFRDKALAYGSVAIIIIPAVISRFL